MRLLSAIGSVVLTVPLCLCLAAPALRAQAPESKPAQPPQIAGLPARATPGDYPSQAKAGNITIAAEFAGHSVPRPDGPLNTEDFVVVEVACYGPAGAKLVLAADNFSLRVNGKKSALPREPYGMVVSSLRDPSWSPPEEEEKKKSKSGLSTGGNQADSGPPPPVKIPIEMQRAMAKYVQEASLHEGERQLPEAGYIFFQYHGSTKKIRSLELIYTGAAGSATLDLQP